MTLPDVGPSQTLLGLEAQQKPPDVPHAPLCDHERDGARVAAVFNNEASSTTDANTFPAEKWKKPLSNANRLLVSPGISDSELPKTARHRSKLTAAQNVPLYHEEGCQVSDPARQPSHQPKPPGI